ncbi:hypothetical protein NFK84_08345 [Enterobacter ludwigii]|jgi:hypothetical protein|uniref:hypothetical protein n=2 Tax=Enterobacterales TaxID=91347 RepID=UPI00059EA4DE|nr:hypothetical protein [Enterobacter ludwigii]EGT4402218.1 hypothetical protein [Cronobacter malonaticus]EGT4418950.1 hypothetical protein [Cronobacter malonaticus]ELV2798314.1 hypothetical protein [Enterobacter ludwigii]WGA06315.1 hypothetical protein NFK84_08345 [Enterobacter ludwigii]
MIRMEFNTYDDGTYYFLYVTEEVRIETNGIDGLQLETCDSRVWDLGERKDVYFNETFMNPNAEELIGAVKTLHRLLNSVDSN